LSDFYLGTVMMFGGNFAINGWATCDGQILAISTNQALFSILGTTYGGNGTSTFGLPDLRGRVPVHQGQGNGLSPCSIGQVGGTENVTLTSNQMPLHTHLVNADGQGGGKTTPRGNIPGAVGATVSEKIYSGANPGNVTMNPAMIGTAGGSQPFSILQPYLCVTFLVALTGIFPSRN
jgi:microcystin-dependent protein